MSQEIIWVHGDCLSPHNPAFEEYPDAPAIWVWDDVLIQEWQIGLKRLTFMYECLLELPVVMRRGDVTEEIIAFAQENQAKKVITIDSPSPRFEKICDGIEKKLDLEIFEMEAFFDYDGYIDLKRFSRYWKVAEKYVFGT
ncbi:DNA polymerase [Calothrix sp. 336/3]|uniref:DNA polymerase n=1 Tax=Calothrix sp. 336/3 TaxID=1337936 RepID=UPI0004E32A45|nr:DNA polymerase [Calothrix sp. 336/3]AKG21684.1 DNA polymerase [Calothrix sp. 336/3]